MSGDIEVPPKAVVFILAAIGLVGGAVLLSEFNDRRARTAADMPTVQPSMPIPLTNPKPTPVASSEPAPTDASEPSFELRVGRWRCHQEYGYEITEGLVTNLTDTSIDQIVAVATYFDRNGNFIKSD